MTTPQTPPGWYDTPDGRQRYWDGSQWTDHFSAAAATSQLPQQPKKGGALKWLLIGLGVFFVLGLGSCIAILAAVDGGTNSAIESSSTEPDSSEAPGETEAPSEAPDAPPETPEAPSTPVLKVTAQQMIEDLEANALAAAQKYKGKRVTVTGTLDNIDASGDYFTLRGKEEFSLTNVQIFIEENQVNTVSGFKADQKVTVTGEVTGVGEILGYSIQAEKIG